VDFGDEVICRQGDVGYGFYAIAGIGFGGIRSGRTCGAMFAFLRDR
jgi:hypothetical protein